MSDTDKKKQQDAEDAKKSEDLSEEDLDKIAGGKGGKPKLDTVKA